MKKLGIIVIISAVLLLISIVGGASTQTQQPNLTNSNAVNSAPESKDEVKISKPICDGTIVTKNCVIDDIHYSSYNYQPAVAEKSHTETVTTYREEVADYCTLCSDGTYSPSCATGRGACSHHGGVAQWNAPRYKTVPEYTTKIVIDAPAHEAYYNKVVE